MMAALQRLVACLCLGVSVVEGFTTLPHGNGNGNLEAVIEQLAQRITQLEADISAIKGSV
jgi:hypothetical protein